MLSQVKSVFREALEVQPSVLIKSIKNETNLERYTVAFNKFLLGDRRLKSPRFKEVVNKLIISDKATISKKLHKKYILRNINKLFIGSPGQALVMFLAAQLGFVGAAHMKLSNFSKPDRGNDTFYFDNIFFTLSQITGNKNYSLSMQSGKDIKSKFAEIPRGRVNELADKLAVLADADKNKNHDIKRYKRSPDLDSSGEFVSADFDQVNDLEIRVAELENQIKSLEEYNKLSGANFTYQISSLENSNIRLRSLVDNLKKDKQILADAKKKAEQDYGSQINKLFNDVKNFNEKIRQNYLTFLPDSCIKDIEARRFKIAEGKLRQIDNEHEIAYIVDRVYKNNAQGRFSLLIEFSKSIKSVQLTLSICTFLDHETRISNSDNVLEIIMLANTLMAEVINQSNISSDTKKKASDLFTSLKDRVKNMAVEVLSAAMENTPWENANVVAISNEVSQLEPILFLNTIRSVIDKMYGKIDAKKILECIKETGTRIPHINLSYMAVFEKIKSDSAPKDNSMFILAYHIKEVLKNNNNTQQINNDLYSLISKIPLSIKNAVFSAKVCVKNLAYKEYLYADSKPLFKYNNDRRYVFTWTPRQKVRQGVWEIGRHGDNYLFKNVLHSEYLYTANNYYKYDEERLRVFTWIPSKCVAAAAEWKIEPSGDNVYIKSSKYSTYLFVDYDKKYDKNRRYTFTWTPGSKVTGTLWFIEDCSLCMA